MEIPQLVASIIVRQSRNIQLTLLAHAQANRKLRVHFPLAVLFGAREIQKGWMQDMFTEIHLSMQKDILHRAPKAAGKSPGLRIL